jgi:hypothetical protein
LEEHSTLIPAHKYKSICKLHNIKHYTDFLFPTINLDISVLHNILEHRPDLASKFAFTIKQEIINENNFLAKKLTEEIIHKFASKFLSIIVILAIFGDLGY